MPKANQSLFHRRHFLSIAAASTVALAAGRAGSQEQRPILQRTTIGFSLYGMKSLATADALAACREIGYDCFELPVMADWPLDSARLTATDRRDLKGQIADSGLRLSALMENLPLLVDDARHRDNLKRLSQATELARELAPDRPPLIETVLGGKPDQWEEVKQQMAKRLEEWAAVAAKSQVVIAVKPHVSGALHRPADAAWLVNRIASPEIRLAFDFSHFEVRGLALDKCLDAMLENTSFIHVKDAAGEPGKVRFLLPGEGKTDYADYLKRLAQRGYAGDVVVEVSGQIHSRPDYDPIAAAKSSFAVLAAARRQIPTHD